ncbi:M12 family metallo-peptidase, partial [Aestuariivirga sp.]|uniref:zinc-dependent metalloprotease family protein n=1 Tax=Aestuariivirga sp. TaxID=2650926 RepID=UPI003016FD89
MTADVHAQQMTRERIRPAFPMISIPERQSGGQAAIDRLGTRLPEVAGWYGKTIDKLRDQLLSDRDVRIDGKGRMFVVEEMQAPLPGSTYGAQDNVMNGQLSPIDQTFLLHSRPGASRTIYLNFGGATITNTAWNANGNTITAKPFDIDGVPGAFSTTELQRVQYIWQRVAEDYAPFDVDVTTEAPSPDRLTRTDSNDQVFGTTVVITDNTGVYSCSCGGIAYVGVFNDTSDHYKPALVFYNMLGKGDEKAVAEAISHEAGHNMGLSHDGTSGTSSTAYYGGQGSDPVTGWAPIMGVGYYKPVVQFSKGEYATASNQEDDFAVAQSYGLPLRADDYGNSIYTASVFPGTGGGTVDGVIERSGDAAAFHAALSGLLAHKPEEAATRTVKWMQAEKVDAGNYEPQLAGLFNAFLQRKDGAALLVASLKDQTIRTNAAVVGQRAIAASGQPHDELAAALAAAAKITTGPRQLSPEEMLKVVTAVKERGDPARGEAIFRRVELNC